MGLELVGLRDFRLRTLEGFGAIVGFRAGGLQTLRLRTFEGFGPIGLIA